MIFHTHTKNLHIDVHCSFIHNSFELKQQRCPSKSGCLNNHAMEHYLAIKRSELLTRRTICMTFHRITLNENSHYSKLIGCHYSTYLTFLKWQNDSNGKEVNDCQRWNTGEPGGRWVWPYRDNEGSLWCWSSSVLWMCFTSISLSYSDRVLQDVTIGKNWDLSELFFTTSCKSSMISKLKVWFRKYVCVCLYLCPGKVIGSWRNRDTHPVGYLLLSPNLESSWGCQASTAFEGLLELEEPLRLAHSQGCRSALAVCRKPQFFQTSPQGCLSILITWWMACPTVSSEQSNNMFYDLPLEVT